MKIKVLIVLSGLLIAGLILAACSPAATPAPEVVIQTVEVPVEVTKEVQVVQTVEVPMEVQVETEVLVTPAPALPDEPVELQYVHFRFNSSQIAAVLVTSCVPGSPNIPTSRLMSKV